jgi:hypothetical protein
MLIFRFINADGTVRLNLNDPTRWHLARGLNVGAKRYEKSTISQPPFDGVVVSSAWAPPVRVTVPLLYGEAGVTKTPVTIRSDYDALRTELRQVSSIIEFREPGDTVSYYMDFPYGPYDEPTIHQGQAPPNPFLPSMRGFAGPIVLELDRAPNLRGAGTMV